MPSYEQRFSRSYLNFCGFASILIGWLIYEYIRKLWYIFSGRNFKIHTCIDNCFGVFDMVPIEQFFSDTNTHTHCIQKFTRHMKSLNCWMNVLLAIVTCSMVQNIDSTCRCVYVVCVAHWRTNKYCIARALRTEPNLHQ